MTQNEEQTGGEGGPCKREVILDLATGVVRPFIAQRPLLSSAHIPWSGVLLEHHAVAATDIHEVSFCKHVLALHLSPAIAFEWKSDGHWKTTLKQAGELSIVPAGVPFSARSDSPAEFILVSLDEPSLHRIASKETNLDNLELTLNLAVGDPLLAAIVGALKFDVESGHACGRLYGDSMIAALSAHLIRSYTVQAPRLKRRAGGLGKKQFRDVIEYIHAHVVENISLDTLAGVTGLSPFHFARMFKQSSGLAPHQYHLKCRLERARELLLSKEARIADVAAQLGFCDQSHFAAHFKRAFGATPGQFLNENSRS